MPDIDNEVVNPQSDESTFDFDSEVAESGSNIDNLEVGGDAATPEVPQQTEGAEGQEAQAEDEPVVEYVYQGETVKVPLSEAQNKLQQIHVLNEKFREFNQQKEGWEQERQQAQQIIDRYKQIDEYAQQNPEWFDYVQQQWQKKQAYGDLPTEIDENDPVAQAILATKRENQELKNELAKFREEIEFSKQSEADQKAEQELRSEIHGVRDEFKSVNFDEPDQHGVSLENRIIKHGLENNMGFKQAFLDYYYPNLIKLERERAMKEAAENIQKKTKMGVVSRGSGPVPSGSPANITGQSWQDLIDSAINEAKGG